MNVSWKAAIAAALGASALIPATARAGTYDVWSCRGADGAALATSAFAPTGKTADTCAKGGSLAATADGASLTLTAPAGTRIAGYELWRSADDGPVADDTEIVEKAGGATTTIPIGTVGDAKHPLAAANHYAGKHAPLDSLALQVKCDDGCTDGTRIDLYSSRVTLSDTTAPTADAQAAGDDAVIVDAADVGGGVASVTMSLDGGAAQTLASDCAVPYTSLVPCPAAVARAFAIAAPDGDHTVSGTVVDAAGNAIDWGPLELTIHHDVVVSSAPPVVTGTTTLPILPGQLVRLSRASLDHAPGSVARLTGTLKTAAGAPVAGAQLTVSSFDLASDKAEPRTLESVTTNASGGFTVALKRDGAQRVTVTSPTGSAATATVRANLSVAVKSSKGRLIKGRLLTLRGKLRGAGASAKGTLVTIESIVNGEWAPVGSARAKADGSYSWRYRFVHLQQDTIFRFRAVVERGPGWPWASESSAPLKVRVDVP